MYTETRRARIKYQQFKKKLALLFGLEEYFLSLYQYQSTDRLPLHIDYRYIKKKM